MKKFKAEKPKEGGRGDHNPSFKRQRSPPMEPAHADFTLDTICGGPHLAGESSKSREKYARTLRHEMADASNCMNVEEKPPRRPRQEKDVISFTEEDAKNVRYPHNDPLVVIVQIANMKVKRCLVDTGSSVDIIYKSSI